MEWIIHNKEWIFSGTGVAIIGVILKIFLTRRKKAKESVRKIDRSFNHNNGIIISGCANVSGNVAGRDIIINPDPLSGKLDELIDIFNFRAELKKAQISLEYEYINTKLFLSKFNVLHDRHIEALKKGNLIAAHEVLFEIHKMLCEMERMNNIRNPKNKEITDYLIVEEELRKAMEQTLQPLRQEAPSNSTIVLGKSGIGKSNLINAYFTNESTVIRFGAAKDLDEIIEIYKKIIKEGKIPW